MSSRVHLHTASVVPELSLHVLGSRVVLEVKRLKERHGSLEVRVVAPGTCITYVLVQPVHPM